MQYKIMKIKFFELKESDKQIKSCKRYDIVGLKEIFVMDTIDHTMRFFGSAALLRLSEHPGYAQLCKVYRETEWGVLTAEFTPLVTEDNERILIHLDRDDIDCRVDSGEMDYNRVFKMKPLFRKIKPVVDNKLNMRYAETEEQYKKLIEKENKVLLSQGKKIKNKNTSVYITKKVDDLKTRIRFMKGIIDFSFPGFVLTKIKAIDKKLKKENEKRYKSKDFSSPVEKRNLTQNKRNEERKAYLCECFNIRSDLNKINN